MRELSKSVVLLYVESTDLVFGAVYPVLQLDHVEVVVRGEAPLAGVVELFTAAGDLLDQDLFLLVALAQPCHNLPDSGGPQHSVVGHDQESTDYLGLGFLNFIVRR